MEWMLKARLTTMPKWFLLTASAGMGFMVGSATADAQSVAERDVGAIERREVFVHSVGTPGAPVEFMSAEFGLSAKTVKEAPYTADASTVTTQVLADGNRIQRKTTSSIARDSEGRTRRDLTLNVINEANDGNPPEISVIFDPVIGVSYTLDHNQKVARKLAGMGMAVRWEGPHLAATNDVVVRKPTAHVRLREGKTSAETESLGRQTIEGVPADGTRTRRVIPAGQIGNERPIEIVNEQWYSPELQVVVMSKHVDPRVGETVYSLTNVRRGEPVRSLFEVPADYAIKEEPAPPMRHLRQP
jgi:hypothetical protein